MPEWRHVEATDVAPYVDGLRRLEAGITYPIADGADHFTIDHGADYAAFYEGLGEAHFLVATHGAEVVGVMAGALRDARIGQRTVPAVYIGDLKLNNEWRGRGLARQMIGAAFGLLRQRRFRQWRLVYFAAMRGDRGDVTRSMRGFNLARLLRPIGALDLYFEPMSRLAELPDGPGVPEGNGLDLSPQIDEDRVRTTGRKDLRLHSTGAPWPLVHLARGPTSWTDGLGAYLRRCADAQSTDSEVACFGLDERLRDHRRWLETQGLAPGARCTVYGLRRSGILRSARWLHLATSDI